MPASPPRADLTINYAGAQLRLLADKAIHWAEQDALLIADVHLGKAATYRRLGQPVPSGTTSGNLARIDRLLARWPSKRLIVLGDFLHAPEAHNLMTLDAIRAWRTQHPSLDVILIRGNHDRRAGDPPADLNIRTVAEPLLLGPLALQHEPDAHPTHAVLAGHVHPMCVLRGMGRDRLRLPCFHMDGRIGLMPSFGLFTGGENMLRTARSATYAIADDAIWAV